MSTPSYPGKNCIRKELKLGQTGGGTKRGRLVSHHQWELKVKDYAWALLLCLCLCETPAQN